MSYDSKHAKERSSSRGITPSERKAVLRSPDRVRNDGEYRLHYADRLRTKLTVVAVIAVGTGAAIVSKSPIFGLGAGTLVTVVTYYLQRKKHASGNR